MSTPREAALAALRAWAEPGARARLIANAWKAGEHSIVVLAEAADVSRPTVYADLAEHGIDPKSDRQEAPMFDTIAIGGFTGTEEPEDARLSLPGITREVQASGLTDQDGDAYVHEVTRILLERSGTQTAANLRNTLVPYANAETKARMEADRALRLVETRWAALRTATAWHAAHHAWVEAVHQARTAINAWQDAVNETQAALRRFSATDRSCYDEHVPEHERLPLDPEPAQRALTAFEETTASRRQITNETLTAVGEAWASCWR